MPSLEKGDGNMRQSAAHRDRGDSQRPVRADDAPPVPSYDGALELNGLAVLERRRRPFFLIVAGWFFFARERGCPYHPWPPLAEGA